MVSVDPNPPDGFYLDPTGMGLVGSFSPPTTTTTTTATAADPASSEDPSKKIRKPYTITKSRESWTEPEHDKFLEALQLFDRDWKKIEAFVGSKTVIQIRSHAQKYFLKAEKSGTNEHLPPPRPKRKAAHPYPQKAPKNALSQSEPGFIRRLAINGAVSSSIDNSVQSVSLSHVSKDDVRSTGQPLANNCSSTESTPRAQPRSEMTVQGNHGSPLRVLPDFGRVYSFIGSVFDPTSNDHLQKLKKMDSIDVETVLLLMRNLSINLTSPDFEDHRRLLSSFEFDLEQDTSGTDIVIPRVNLSENVAQ